MAKQGSKDIEQLVKEIRGFHTELDAIKKGMSSTLGEQSDALAAINAELNKSISAFKKIRNAQNLSLDKEIKRLDYTKSLADVYKQLPDAMVGFKNKMMDTLSVSQKLKSMANAASGAKKEELKAYTDSYNTTLSLATELAQLSKEDTLEYGIKSNEIQKSLNLLQTQADAYALINGKENETFQFMQRQIAALQEIVLLADSHANLEGDVKRMYESLYEDIGAIGKQFRKVAYLAEQMLKSPRFLMGVLLYQAGELFDEFALISREIGGSVLQMTGFKVQAFAVSKILGQEAGRAVTSLAQKLGNANDVSVGLGINVGTMSNRLGVSGEDAAQLVNQFGNLSGLSSDTALNTMEATSQLAMANGIAPAAVMQDIAQNTEFFALYSKNGGANIAQAAIEARRLGVDLSTVSKISDNLLDYQTSVSSEMEASVLLGRNLNLNRARELAYAGDSAGAMKEALDAAGGIAEFNKMDVYQKRAVADAIGTSVSELQQMSANQERALTPAGKLEATFDSIGSTVTELGTTVGGTILKGFGGLITFTGQWSRLLTDTMNGPLGGIFSKVGKISRALINLPAKGLNKLSGGMLGRGVDKIKGFFDNGGATESISTRAGGKEAKTAASQKQMAGGFTAMGQPGVGMGIINTALAGPALLLFAIGTPGMMAISSFGVGTGKGLSGLSKGMMAFSAVPMIAVGVLAATGAAFAVMTLGTIGLAAIAIGGEAAGAGLIGLSAGLETIGAAAATGLPFLGVGLIAAFGFALQPLTTALSSLAPLVTSIGQTISVMFTSMANAFVMMESSLPNLVTNFLPLIAMAGPIFLLSTAIGALAISLLALGAASVVAMPALAVAGFAAGAGFGMMGGEVSAGGNGDAGLLAEIQGLREDIKNLAVVVNLDSRQIYKGQVQTIKNNS